jgi:hypothetical protein
MCYCGAYVTIVLHGERGEKERRGGERGERENI